MDAVKVRAGRMGGRAAAERMTPEQRQERGRRAYLAGAVRTVAARVGDLTEAERAALRAALTRAA